MVKQRRLYPLYLCALFLIASLVSAVICKMIVTDTVYLCDSQVIRKASVTDAVGILCESLRSSAVQLAVIWFVGHSCFAFQMGLVIFAYRGVCFGYTASAFSESSLVLERNFDGLFSEVGIPRMTVILFLYLTSSVAVAYMSYLSVRRADALLKNSVLSISDRMRYILAFIVLSGAVFLCDFLKLIVL